MTPNSSRPHGSSLLVMLEPQVGGSLPHAADEWTTEVTGHGHWTSSSPAGTLVSSGVMTPALVMLRWRLRQRLGQQALEVTLVPVAFVGSCPQASSPLFVPGPQVGGSLPHSADEWTIEITSHNHRSSISPAGPLVSSRMTTPTLVISRRRLWQRLEQQALEVNLVPVASENDPQVVDSRFPYSLLFIYLICPIWYGCTLYLIWFFFLYMWIIYCSTVIHVLYCRVYICASIL